MIGHLTFGDIGRMADVFRWHSCWPRRPQNIAEHSFLVALYAVRLGYEIHPNLLPSEVLEILELALVHDAPETTFGDIPSPTKAFLRGTLGLDVDQRLDGFFWTTRAAEDPWLKASDQAQRLVRVADILEATLFHLRHGSDEGRTPILVQECLVIASHQLPGIFPTIYDLLERAGAGEDLLQNWQQGEAARG